MERIVSIRLRDTGQNFIYNANDLEMKENDYVIVEHDRGLDYGQVVSLKGEVDESQQKTPVKKIIRVAKESDLKQIDDNRARSKEAFSTCLRKIAEHKLEMKLVQAEYSFDRSKIIFYFTSGGRVDFRNLVKDLAKIFKARIELRQIGVRDETKFFGGYGPCGRQLCCSTFLKDFEPVTIKMAKEEGLPLNPPKISGICGRLMCCLNYEYETYKMLSKGLPREGERITTAEGKGKVINVNVFKRSATVELEEGKIIEVAYSDKPGVLPCRQECCNQEKGEQQEGSTPEKPAQPSPYRDHRNERQQERTARPDNRPERGRPDQRPERQDRNRPDHRNERRERYGGRPDQQRPERQDRNRPDQRGQERRDRNDRNRPDRNRPDQRNERNDRRDGRGQDKPQDRPAQQERPGQEKPKPPSA